MLSQHVCRVKTTEVAGLDVSNACLGRITQGGKAQFVFQFPTFNQPQTFA